MAPILANAVGYASPKLDDEDFQNIYDGLQATELPLGKGSVEQLVTSLKAICERSLKQQVSLIHAVGRSLFAAS